MIMDYTPGYHVGDRNNKLSGQKNMDSTDAEDTNSEDESDATTEESHDVDATDAEDTNSEDESDATTEESHDVDATDAEGTNSEDGSENTTEGSDARSAEDDHSVNNRLWKQLVILCYNKKSEPLDMLKGYIQLHIDSESDKIFENIMSDVIDAELRDISDQKAIEYALKENEESILASVSRCEKNGEDKLFWCRLAEKGGGLDCQLFTGKSCCCEKCNGLSILSTVKVAMKVFVGMRDDNLIQQIEAEIVNNMSDDLELGDVIDQVVKKYKEDNTRKITRCKGYAQKMWLESFVFFLIICKCRYLLLR